MGASVQGNPDLYNVTKGASTSFSQPRCLKAFKEAPEKYLETANAWAADETARPRPESLRKG